MGSSESREPSRVRGMFDRVSGRYDLLNHLLSLNLDRRWRREAAREAAAAGPGPVLDLCGGTGDLTLAVARASEAPLVVCCDFSHGMLERAGAKFARRGPGARCLRVEADGLRLPFRDASFAAVTVAFGVRNLVDLDAGLREMRRVLVDGGRLVVLEFSRPTGPVLGRLYRVYLRGILPRLGDGISGHRGPYGYLARTIAEFPDAPTFAGRIRDSGYRACGWRGLTGGIVALHTAFR